MRRLIAIAVLLAGFSVPSVVNPPVAAAAVCTGWNSVMTPPTTIKVLRTATGIVETVDFKTYVKIVLPAEWSPGLAFEHQRMGAVVVKQYAWYRAMHWRGGSSNGNCYDVVDSTNDQIYSPGRTLYANQNSAVDATWPLSLTKSGSLFLTPYRTGSSTTCGSDANGGILYQASAKACISNSAMTAEQALAVYFYPGFAVQGAPNAYDPTTFTAITPTRLLDTRDPQSPLTGAFVSHVSRTLQITGTNGIPAEARAITGNLTVTNQSAAGFLYIGPNPANLPMTSNLNFPTGDTRANSVTTSLSDTGSLSITYASFPDATADVVLDVTGYFTEATTGARYVALTPNRVLDSRAGAGQVGLAAQLDDNVPASFAVTGLNPADATLNVPANAVAVTGNLTVTNQTSKGYLTLSPAKPDGIPGTSTLNFPAGDNRANGVTVPLGDDGELWVTFEGDDGAKTDVIFDVTGYFTSDGSGAMYVPLTPGRVLDTRYGIGGLSGRFAARVPRTFLLAGHGDVPANATAVTGNLTVVGQTGYGFLYIGPAPLAYPTTSTLNFPYGDIRANSVAVRLGDDGTLSVTYVGYIKATTNAVFDVTGYFVAPTS
jgi:hypothetical protein